MRKSFLRFFVHGVLAAFAVAPSTLAALTLATTPSSPVGHVVFQVTFTGMMTGASNDIAGDGESPPTIWLDYNCMASCGVPTLQTRTMYLRLPPGEHDVVVYASRRAEDAVPTIHKVRVSSTNPAVLQADPGLAFMPARVAVTAQWHVGFSTSSRPTVRVEGNTIFAYLDGWCPFVCPGGGRLTYHFDLPSLPPGTYNVVVSPGNEEGRGWSAPYIPATGQLVIGAGPNYQGLWWGSPAGAESGWGMQVAHQEHTLFVTWYTYDRDGSPTWFVIPDAQRVKDGFYTGDLYRTTALPSGRPFDLSNSTAYVREGKGSLQFNGPDDGLFWYEIGSQVRAKPITRQVYAIPSTCVAARELPTRPNFQDLWWNAPAGSESGWGVQIAHQGDILFGTFFGYDAQGKGRWLVMPDGRKTADGVYEGAVYSTRGPAFDAIPWLPAGVSHAIEGTARFAFTGHSQGSFSIAPLNGSSVAAQKAITRQVFKPYPTVCD